MSRPSKIFLIVICGVIVLLASCSKHTKSRLSPRIQEGDSREDQFEVALAETGCGIDPKQSFSELIREIDICIERYKSSITPNILEKFPDESFGLVTVEEAFDAVSGEIFDFGIGSALVKDSALLMRGHNSQLSTKRSDYHGEMVVLNAFENLGGQDKENLVLFTSAEPCPMCFTRIIIAGVPTKYVTSIDGDGMVSHVEGLPTEWKEVAQKTPITQAKCSPELQALAKSLFLIYKRR